MAKPSIVLINDDERELQALADDLGRRFGTDYGVLGEGSPDAALETLIRLASRSQRVALLVAAQQVTGSSGVELLLRGHELDPAAKRVLLIDRGTWASGEAIARDDARPGRRLPVHAVAAAGTVAVPAGQRAPCRLGEDPGSHGRAGPHRRSALAGPRSRDPRLHHARRDALRVLRGGLPGGSPAAGGGRPGRHAPARARLLHGKGPGRPVDRRAGRGPGVQARPDRQGYDVVIVGAGPAGLAAGVYAASEGLRTLVLEPDVPGGQAGTSSRIRNYLGFPRGISGEELTYRALEQAWLFGADFVLAQSCAGLAVRGRDRVVLLADGGEVVARAVVVATGIAWRRLGVPALEALGDMSGYLVQEIAETLNVQVRPRTEVVDGHGRGRLEGLTLRDRASGATETIPAAALFVLIGGEPRTQWLAGTLQRDDRGYVLTGGDLLRGGKPPHGWPLARPPLLLEASVPGVFAVGDVRHRSVKRVAPAVGAGAIAIQLVHEYLEG